MLSDNIIAPQGGAQAQRTDCRILQDTDRTADKQLASADMILTMLHAIARESEAVYATSRALFVARATARTIEHTMTTHQLGHSCNLLVSRIAALQKLVIEFDEDIAGVEMGSLAELGVRAQTLALLLLLDELCDAMPYRSSTHLELFTGRLRTIEDVVWYLFDSLARINKLWLHHRAKPHALAAELTPRVFNTTGFLEYRSAIRRAQRAIAELGADPDFAHFLRVGSSSTDAPRIRRACDQLADVLSVALAREPDPALFLAAAVLEPEELLDPARPDGRR